MKKKTINLSWPAGLYGFTQDEKQEKFSRGKLKVFYRGETADHRYFSESFSNELIKTLPYTPVVGFYDDDKDDFVGHATEQQILGIVDPRTDVEFKLLDDGNTWAICDVVLYTERPGKVGELAKKIEGHKQSLEMDPKTLKYNINYDERKHFKNIEFTAGEFIGVSVLGEDQRPAFTGSAFFNDNSVFEQKMKLLKNYCESNGQIDGGNSMNINDFMKLSWGEISTKVAEAIEKEYGSEYYTYLIDMFDNSAVVRFYSLLDGSNKLMRIDYSNNNDNIVLGNIRECRITYEDITIEKGVDQAEEITSVDVVDNSANDIQNKEEDGECAVTNEQSAEESFKNEESEDEDKESEDKVEDKESEDKDEDKLLKDEEFKKKKCKLTEVNEDEKDKKDSFENQPENCAAAAPDTNAENTETDIKVSVENENSAENQSSSTSFTESERAELEALKKAKKVEFLNSYKDILSEEEFNKYSISLDNFTEEGLELELLRKFKENAGQNKKVRAFAFAPVPENVETKSLDDIVKVYLNR